MKLKQDLAMVTRRGESCVFTNAFARSKRPLPLIPAHSGTQRRTSARHAPPSRWPSSNQDSWLPPAHPPATPWRPPAVRHLCPRLQHQVLSAVFFLISHQHISYLCFLDDLSTLINPIEIKTIQAYRVRRLRKGLAGCSPATPSSRPRCVSAAPTPIRRRPRKGRNAATTAPTLDKRAWWRG